MFSANSLQLNNKMWQIEKYQRLLDVRNCPVAVERKGTNDLIVQVNMNLKMLSIDNNEIKLEEFCFSPLVYSHDVICKDLRVLFTVKSQKDGNTNAKFRIRFRTSEACQNFCSFLSNFLTITMYEDLQKNDFQNNSIMPESTPLAKSNFLQQPITFASRPSSQPSLLNRSFGSEGFNLNRSFGELNRSMTEINKPAGSYANQSFSEADYLYSMSIPEPSLNRSFSENLNLSMAESTKSWMDRKDFVQKVNKVGIDMYTQTAGPTNNISVQSSYNDSSMLPTPSLQNQLPPIQPIVNITIGSLVSDEAMKGFNTMIQTFLERVFLTMTKPTKRGKAKNLELFSALKKSCNAKKSQVAEKQTRKRQASPETNCLEENIVKKKVYKRVKKEKICFVKPQPTMPKNRTAGIAYRLRGATQPSVSNICDNNNNKIEINLERNDEEENEVEIENETAFETFSSQDCWY